MGGPTQGWAASVRCGRIQTRHLDSQPRVCSAPASGPEAVPVRHVAHLKGVHAATSRSTRSCCFTHPARSRLRSEPALPHMQTELLRWRPISHPGVLSSHPSTQHRGPEAPGLESVLIQGGLLSCVRIACLSSIPRVQSLHWDYMVGTQLHLQGSSGFSPAASPSLFLSEPSWESGTFLCLPTPLNLPLKESLTPAAVGLNCTSVVLRAGPHGWNGADLPGTRVGLWAGAWNP